MADTNDTIDGLLAEMRDEAAKADMEQDYSVDDAAEMMREFAWRFEAAIKRERGDAAKLREALKICLHCMCQYCRMDAEARGMTTECVNGCEALLMAKAALAEPPRNCDRFATAEEARQAWLDDAGNWDEFGSPKLELHEWLYAPATEKEGGAK